MTWLLSLLSSVPQAIGLASKGIDYFLKRADGDVARAQALMQLEQERIKAQRDITVAGMSHPIWWAAWAMFVVPVGFHFAKCVVWDATLGLGTTDPLAGYVREWAGIIVASIFGLQVGVGIVGGILNRIVKR